MEISTTVLLSCFACALGICAGWIISQLKHLATDRKLIELRAQIQTSEKLLEESKYQADKKEQNIDSLQKDLSSALQAKTTAETKLQEAFKNLQEQKNLLERTEEKLITTFKALSGESLKSNNKAFLELAQQSLEVVLSKSRGEFGKREESIKGTVSSLENALKRYEKQVSELENKRVSDYSSLETQIKSLVSNNQQLQKETGNLVTALRRPEIRGRWGEITLKRVVELSGMSQQCDFSEQISVNTEDGRLRPDMIVHLPGKREIVVDSKVSLDAYIDAISAENPEKKKDLIKKHAQHIRKHMRDLSQKNYWDQFPQTPEFVVMFIPGESFLSAALEVDHTLIEDGMHVRVIIATPTTLIALLRAVAFGWRQEQVTKHAQEIAKLGKEIYDRLEPFLQHVNKTSDYLSQSVTSFNKMISSLEHRVITSARKFKELGISGDKKLPETHVIEQTPRKTDSS